MRWQHACLFPRGGGEDEGRGRRGGGLEDEM